MVNFAILVWLLNKVLYGPILSAINKREEGFEQRSSQLEKLEQACRELQHELEAEKLELKDKSEELMREALAEAQSVKEHELEKVRKEIQNLDQRWRDGLEDQREQFFSELRRRTAESIWKIAGRVLEDLSGHRDLQTLVVTRFLEKCSEVELEGPALIKCAGELDTEQQGKLRERFPEATFEVEPDLLIGLEIVHQGKRLGWSARTHLEAMTAELDSALREASAV